MIPKIIHYCWFGGKPLPPLALECIASWRKFLPNYEIWQWSESQSNYNDNYNYNSVADKVMGFDVNSIPYTAEAYRQGKYAFVSDYARFWILHKYGGVYFDTDVEVIRSMDDIISCGAFMGFEQDSINGKRLGLVNPGLGLGMEAGMPLVKEILEYYNFLKFDMNGGKPTTIVGHVTNILISHGMNMEQGIQYIEGVNIYPSEYFCPIHIVTKRLHITKNTRSIHRYMDSWNNKRNNQLKEKVRMIIPEWMLLLFNKLKH